MGYRNENRLISSSITCLPTEQQQRKCEKNSQSCFIANLYFIISFAIVRTQNDSVSSSSFFTSPSVDHRFAIVHALLFFLSLSLFVVSIGRLCVLSVHTIRIRILRIVCELTYVRLGTCRTTTKHL